MFIRILIFITPGSRIKQYQQKRKGKKICCPTCFCSYNYDKSKSDLIFEQVQKNFDLFPSSSAGLPGANIGHTPQAGSVQSFKKVLMKPDRTVNTQDPLENTYRFAEGHFHRMMMQYSGRSIRISGITIVVNTKLAENFEKKRNAFTRDNKGWFTILNTYLFFSFLILFFINYCTLANNKLIITYFRQYDLCLPRNQTES
jgi:hypothetical protein